MKVIIRFLSPLLIPFVITPPSFGAVAVTAPLDSAKAIESTLDQAVLTYGQFKSASEWLSSSTKEKKLTPEDVRFFSGKLAGSYSPLPTAKRVGSEIHLTHPDFPVVIKFGDLPQHRIEINNTAIDFTGLSGDQLYNRIQDAMPKTSGNHFTLIPNANAFIIIPLILIAAAIIVCLVTGVHDYHALSSGLSACEKALISPQFKSPPKTEEEKKKIVDFLASEKSIHVWQDTRNDNFSIYAKEQGKLTACVSKLETHLNKLMGNHPTGAGAVNSGTVIANPGH